MGILRSLLPTLCCPDDGGALARYPDRLECLHCHRDFPASLDYAELVALTPAAVDPASAYGQEYKGQRGPGSPEGRSFWQISASDETALERKRRQVSRVAQLLGLDGPAPVPLLCDFSAGPGYYTLPYARRATTVIHADLSPEAIGLARREAARQNLTNILFLRMDYLRPPFRHSLGRILCVDSLVRGEEHERALLTAIGGALAPGGAAVVDFHNWWHNPLRRLGLLADNFHHNRSYRRAELPALLARAGIADYECFPFHQELPTNSWAAPLAALGLPPTRWMFRFHHAAATNSRSA